MSDQPAFIAAPIGKGKLTIGVVVSDAGDRRVAILVDEVMLTFTAEEAFAIARDLRVEAAFVVAADATGTPTTEYPRRKLQ